MGDDWEGAQWGPAASPAHLNDQCIASQSAFYEELFAHISGDGSTSDVWSTIDPNIGPWTNENGKENCILAINEVAAGGDNPGGGPGWCARPTASHAEQIERLPAFMQGWWRLCPSAACGFKVFNGQAPSSPQRPRAQRANSLPSADDVDACAPVVIVRRTLPSGGYGRM